MTSSIAKEKEKERDPEVGQDDATLVETDRIQSGGDEEKQQDEWIVKWDGPDDPEDPLNTPEMKKWIMTAVLAIACACVTCCSSMAADAYAGMEKRFGVSQEVCILSVSLFVAGLGVGPLFLGPISEFVGRSKVLHYSFGAFFCKYFHPSESNKIAVHLVFRFLTGFGGSAFLSVSGGAITDVFRNEKVGTPMLAFSASPFIGPVLGPLISGFINQNAYWRWTFYVVLIWAGVMLILLVVFVPETYNSELLRRKAIRLRKQTGEQRWRAPVELSDRTFVQALKTSIQTPFILMSTQLMVLFLDLWSSIILGILYLSFGGINYIFRTQYGFTLEQTGLAFLGIGAGQVIAVFTQPYFNRHYKRVALANGGKAPPEARLIAGCYGAVLCPLGLLLMGLTSFKNVPWIIPILCSSFFGWGMVYSFTSTFTYLVDAYRPVAASALASNSFMRSAFAAGFPLFGEQLYERLGAVGGTCLLGGLMCLTIPLPFIFHRLGARIRSRCDVASQ
ncbi:hypothetical protein M231_01639 [Tremella mesenterica]|uniref:Major facilitator superfamily (MFS) profile domain-containing protein n=1 Tax=Tremella mesenterica TaxID=5217 RepID=A0A4Q1BSR9_TREME|nr:hypothetical protein M231_01639 [Tremella mesenterica]